MVGTIRNVNYEKLGEAERRILDQEGSGINNSCSRSGMTMSMTTATANGTESSGRPPTRSDSLRGDARQVSVARQLRAIVQPGIASPNMSGQAHE